MVRIDIDKLVTRDIDNRLKKTKSKRIAAIFGIPFGFIMFGAGMPITIIFSPYFAFIPAIGFLLLPLCSILLSKFYTDEMQLKQIVFIRNAIRDQEKIFIYQIGMGEIEIQTLALVTKLIEVGELKGYRIVNNVAIVKDDIFVSQENIMREYMMIRFGKTDTDENTNMKECAYCHEQIPENSYFCNKCGARQ